jgi:hypothetical protein
MACVECGWENEDTTVSGWCLSHYYGVESTNNDLDLMRQETNLDSKIRRDDCCEARWSMMRSVLNMREAADSPNKRVDIVSQLVVN